MLAYVVLLALKPLKESAKVPSRRSNSEKPGGNTRDRGNRHILESCTSSH